MLLIGPVGLVFFFRWAATDEVALDYSDLSPIIGVADAQLNGYTFITGYLTENEFDGIEAFQSRSAFERAPADLAGITAQLAEHEPLCRAFGESVKRPQFVIDVPVTPDALIPAVGGLRTYVQAMILKARLNESSGAPNGALKTLIEAQAVVEAFSKCQGALIYMLTTVAVSEMLSEEIEGILAASNFDQETLVEALLDYQIHEQLNAVVKDAYRQEFNFLKNSISMIVDDSEGFLYESIHADSGFGSVLEAAKMKLLFHRNRTTNRFFQAYRETIQELDQPVCVRNFPINEAFEAHINERPMLWHVRSRNPIGKVFGDLLLPSLDKVMRIVALAEFRTRATYLSIALKSYQLDTGQLPEHLSELVPEYLSEIPKDPYDGQPLRYSRDRLIIYSVGTDGLDSGGSNQLFLHQLPDDEDQDSAEQDELEPTVPLRFGVPASGS